ncbi:MAG: hypothetical protein ABW001_10465 [Mycobacterium sp.]
MDRPYSTYSRTSSPTSETGRTATRGARTGGFTDVETDFPRGSDVHDYDSYKDSYGDSYGEHEDEYDDGYDEIYSYEDPIDRRWIWVAGVAGAILLIAVICTVVILGGGDSGSVSKTIMATTPTTAPVATSTAPPAMTSAAPAAPVAPLSPETVTTIAPSPSATATDPAPAVAAPSPGAITYQVTGTRPLLDLVTVVYTDAQGALQTEFNVALPWSRTVTLDPGVELKSVTATSLTGQLNCSIIDASGAAIVAQATNSMITTCTK